jgi:putative transposase
VNRYALIATDVNADGSREILGLAVAIGRGRSGELAFLGGLGRPRMSGIQLVTNGSNVTVEAIGAQ